MTTIQFHIADFEISYIHIVDGKEETLSEEEWRDKVIIIKNTTTNRSKHIIIPRSINKYATFAEEYDNGDIEIILFDGDTTKVLSHNCDRIRITKWNLKDKIEPLRNFMIGKPPSRYNLDFDENITTQTTDILAEIFDDNYSIIRGNLGKFAELNYRSVCERLREELIRHYTYTSFMESYTIQLKSDTEIRSIEPSSRLSRDFLDRQKYKKVLKEHNYEWKISNGKPMYLTEPLTYKTKATDTTITGMVALLFDDINSPRNGNSVYIEASPFIYELNRSQKRRIIYQHQSDILELVDHGYHDRNQIISAFSNKRLKTSDIDKIEVNGKTYSFDQNTFSHKDFNDRILKDQFTLRDRNIDIPTCLLWRHNNVPVSLQGPCYETHYQQINKQRPLQNDDTIVRQADVVVESTDPLPFQHKLSFEDHYNDALFSQKRSFQDMNDVDESSDEEDENDDDIYVNTPPPFLKKNVVPKQIEYECENIENKTKKHDDYTVNKFAKHEKIESRFGDSWYPGYIAEVSLNTNIYGFQFMDGDYYDERHKDYKGIVDHSKKPPLIDINSRIDYRMSIICCRRACSKIRKTHYRPHLFHEERFESSFSTQGADSIPYFPATEMKEMPREQNQNDSDLFYPLFGQVNEGEDEKKKF